MSWSDFYLFCFLIGFSLSAISFLAGAVHLHLRRPRRVEGQLTIVPTAIREGWQYRIDVPEQVEWRRLVRAIVEVVLIDLANHDLRRTDCVRPPLWLAEGLDSLLVTASGRDLVLEPQTTLNRNARRPDPLAPVRATLAGRDPSSFSDLSLPDPAALADPERFAYFRASATLLVFELLRDDEGRTLARDFLHQLPYHLNWQTAFLRASNGRFQTLLDAEKWWAVGAADVLSRDPSLLWPRDSKRRPPRASWRKGSPCVRPSGWCTRSATPLNCGRRQSPNHRPTAMSRGCRKSSQNASERR